MQVYPYKLRPIFKQRIWGGQKLKELFGKELPAGEKIGESWELADLPNDKSVIANGELAGLALNEAIQKYTKEITGYVNFTLPFPLLIKFLDAADILSVQVHPDEQTCRRMGKGVSKTECWYIVQAEPGAVIYKGLKNGVTKERFAEAIEKGIVAELLEQVPVKAGQCHFLPAGTAHTIGPGILIAEIQTPSDTTYRVFDFNRLDEAGKPRPLHIKEALESIHFDPACDNLSVTTAGHLVECPYFIIDKGHQPQDCEMLIPAGRLKVLVFLAGSGSFAPKKGQTTGFKAGDCFVIPAAFKGTVQFAAETQYLAVTLPENK
jgi:mannose-6-phosphate isomerase